MACGADAEFVGYERSQSVVAGLADGGLRDGPHEIARAALQELVGEKGGFEFSDVVRGGDEAAAGNFVAGVEDASVVNGAGFVFVRPAGGVRGVGEEDVGLPVGRGRVGESSS